MEYRRYRVPRSVPLFCKRYYLKIIQYRTPTVDFGRGAFCFFQSHTYEYDSLKRISKKTLATDTPFKTEYGYAAGKRTFDYNFNPSQCEGRTVSGDFDGNGKETVRCINAESNSSLASYEWQQTSGSKFTFDQKFNLLI